MYRPWKTQNPWIFLQYFNSFSSYKQNMNFIFNSVKTFCVFIRTNKQNFLKIKIQKFCYFPVKHEIQGFLLMFI